MPKKYEEIQEVMDRFSPFLEYIQLDIMDGVYVEAKTWPFLGNQNDNLKELQEKGMSKGMKVQLDLMVLDPLQDIESYLLMDPSQIIFHASSCDLSKLVEYKNNGTFGETKIGLAFQVTDDISDYEKFIPDFDFIQCMGIETIGKQGEPFDPLVVEKIKKLKQLFPEKEIQVDGGVTPESATILKEAGVSALVSGSYLLKSDDVKTAIDKLM